MKRNLILTTLIFFFGFKTMAQPGCPKLAVLVDNYDIDPNSVAVFTVVPSTWGNMVSIKGKTCNWSVSAGTIISGQGTNSITVSAVGLTNQSINATVQVRDLTAQCPNSATATINVKAKGSATVWKPVNVCIMEKEKLTSIQAMYNNATGDTMLFRGGSREVFRDVYYTNNSYASMHAWYFNNEPVTLNGKTYVKYGLPRILLANDVVKAGSFKGVTIFAEPSKTAAPEVIYIPVRLDCEFQPYQRQ